MATGWDAGGSEFRLEGNGAGFAEMRKALPAPPSGVKQVMFLIRGGFDTLAADGTEANAWDDAWYFGFCFDGNHISGDDPVDYDKFVGAWSMNSTDPNVGLSANYMSISQGDWAQDLTAMGNNSADPHDRRQMLSDGYDAEKFANYRMVLGADTGIPYLGSTPADWADLVMVWRFFKSNTDNSVTAQVWTNNGALALGGAMDLETDLNANNPEALIPRGTMAGFDYFKEWTVHGDITGTNWVDGAGNFQVPTHFIAKYPLYGQAMVFKNVGVQYAI